MSEPKAEAPSNDASEASTVGALHRALLAEHTQFEAMLEGLFEALRDGEAAVLRTRWDAFAVTLRAHIHAEEVGLLPPFAAAEPTEAATLRAEHAAILALVTRISADPLAALGQPAIARELAETLRVHALREEVLFHPWTDQHTPRDVARAVLARLRAAIEAVEGALLTI